jgi:hypothetical protein
MFVLGQQATHQVIINAFVLSDKFKQKSQESK